MTDEKDKKADDKPKTEAAQLDEALLTDVPVKDIPKPDIPETLTQPVESAKPLKIHKNFGAFLKTKLGISLAAGLGVVVILATLYLVPATRYGALGLVLKKQATIVVLDKSTGKPITQADVTLAGFTAKTDVQGQAVFAHVPVGEYTANITKKYYKNATQQVTVPVFGAADYPTVHFQATGRQVPVVVVNKISGKPVAKATVSAGGSSVTTDDKGQGVIILPANKATVDGTVILSGYNSQPITITVTEQADTKNNFSLTPTGRVFFLSNLSGKVDVVSTNLDGSDRQTVLAGTGNETAQSTVLLASRDWKYLALQAQRSSSGNPELDLIDTSSGQLTAIDKGDASFTPVGWDGDSFIYKVNRSNILDWQPGQEVLKSFDATTKTLKQLEQTAASGSDTSNWAKQQLSSVFIINGSVLYALSWTASYNAGYNIMNGKTATLNTINADGSHKNTIKSVTGKLNEYSLWFSLITYDGPNTVAVQIPDDSNYYEYKDGKLSLAADITDQSLYATNYPTYLLSPSGNQTFWAALTDGKNNLNVGDSNAGNPTNVARLSEYGPYGWYTDDYLLVSKNGSELYIMPAAGGAPLKISDYFKPSQIFRGYGGGYGGL
ncbi:MAG TPA: carboxypeptidase regulatory-like domain-containing protein [Candidatus Acidoferrum sp.]|nr:carboxypeptidase regulatory-like domain-containing protein [Candidatus Acidoferrum sp.]